MDTGDRGTQRISRTVAAARKYHPFFSSIPPLFHAVRGTVLPAGRSRFRFTFSRLTADLAAVVELRSNSMVRRVSSQRVWNISLFPFFVFVSLRKYKTLSSNSTRNTRIIQKKNIPTLKLKCRNWPSLQN